MEILSGQHETPKLFLEALAQSDPKVTPGAAHPVLVPHMWHHLVHVTLHERTSDSPVDCPLFGEVLLAILGCLKAESSWYICHEHGGLYILHFDGGAGGLRLDSNRMEGGRGSGRGGEESKGGGVAPPILKCIQ